MRSRRARQRILWDRQQLAEVVDCHPDRISHYAAQGMPVAARGGSGQTRRKNTYDAVACLAWIREHGGSKSSPRELAYARLSNANASMAEDRLAREKANLVSREVVIESKRAMQAGLHGKMRQLRNRVAHLLTVPPSSPDAEKIFSEIDTEIDAWRIACIGESSTKKGDTKHG